MLEKVKHFGNWIRSHALLASVCYTLFFFTLLIAFGRTLWETSDDFTVSMLLSGSFGMKSVFTVVCSHYLGSIIIRLQSLIPAINWLGVFELLAVLITFIIINYWLLKHAKDVSLVFALLVSPIFECDFLVKLQYSRSAALLVFAGLLLLFEQIVDSSVTEDEEKQKKRRIIRIALSVLGFSFVLVGSFFRFACTYLGVVYTLPVFAMDVIPILFGSAEDKAKRKKLILFAAAAVICFGTAFGLKTLAEHVDAEDEYIQEYREFNLSRANAYDYLPSDYSKLSASGRELVSENDFFMLKRAMTNDACFGKEYWDELYDALRVQNSKPEDVKQGAAPSLLQIMHGLFDDLSRYNQGRYKGHYSLLIVSLFASLSALFCINKKNCFSILSVTAGTAVIVLYFNSNGRFPPWIADSVYFLTSAVLVMSIVRFPPEGKSVLNRIKITLSIMLFACCVALRAGEVKKDLDGFYYDEGLAAVIEYAQENPASAFILDSVSGIPSSAIDLYGPLVAVQENTWANIVRVGNWDVEHPVKNEQLEDLGISSPIRSLLSDKVYLISRASDSNYAPDTLSAYQIFFREHYGVDDVTYDMVYKYGKWAVYSLTP